VGVVIDRRALLKDLQARVKVLEKDLVEQVGGSGPIYSNLHAEYDAAFRLKRTAATWTVWRNERVTQAAVAWVLGTVFVRFCEDNGLFGTSCFLAGPTKDRAVWAEESQEEYFRLNPAKTDRDWVLAAFDHIGRTQAGRTLFDPAHNAAYQLPISHDGAKELIAFWRRTDEHGVLAHDFTDPDWDTRFLGDLYQDLSEATRKTYALLQTPEFVEEFILDLTLKPAIDEFGHDVVKMIDPTCGSGHFVLGAFRRMVDQWDEHAPGRDRHEVVRLALEAVHGVDINPFAVAVARFRLLIAALKVAEFKTFDEAAQYSFPFNLAVGDSLIKQRPDELFTIESELADFQYAIEDRDSFPGILADGKYHVVVGNPPYITVSDKESNKSYRQIYDTCAGTYSLSIPFAQQFFELAVPAAKDGRGAGFVGQITANSFMKREFGWKLITDFFGFKVELTRIIDTSAAYIPGHSTPTVILIGRRRRLERAGTIRVVMGIRGEPSEPVDPAIGNVWQAIVRQHDTPDSESEWVSVADVPRSLMSKHPWTISGGGASDVSETIASATKARLSSRIVSPVGRAIRAGADEAFIRPAARRLRTMANPAALKPLMVGDAVRDWNASPGDVIWYPYSGELSQAGLSEELWPWRQILAERRTFQGTMADAGLRWWEYMQHTASAYRTPLSVTFAEVATHNHFVLDRGEKIFKQTAPVIKLGEGASEDDHLQLLGVLNSSTACFWLKQVSHDKGSQSGTGGFMHDEWERFYQFAGTKIQGVPLPSAYPIGFARLLDGAAQRLTALSPASVAAEAVPTRERLAAARDGWLSTRARMIALQEELDWQVYSLYGLLPDELTAPADSVPELRLGERAFEIVLARKVAAGEAETQWFVRHGSTPVTELPAHWSDEYRAVVRRRIDVIESNKYLALIERPECKRRWATDGWDKMQARALRDWLLDKCETRGLWFATDENGSEQPRTLSTAQLTDELRKDADFTAVADLYAPGTDLATVVTDLIDSEHVPHLAALRYKDSGLDKRVDWEHVWDLQREEDAAVDEQDKQRIRKNIPVPPKYGQADFRKQGYWSQRGKLDVPKERFISYPLATRDGDGSLLIGWAGWDHREQAQALSLLVVERGDHDGWAAERLTPLLAGLREVMPWVRQWHGAFDPELGDSPAEIYDGFLAERLATLHLTDADLVGWRPPAAVRGRRRP
jgi:uncharacterized protein DUF7008/Eco57I restriction-modification methylase